MSQKSLLEQYNELANRQRSLKRDSSVMAAVNYFRRFGVSLDTFHEDIERLNKVSPKAAEKVAKFAGQLQLVGVDAETSTKNIEALTEAYEIAEKRLSKFQKVLDKAKGFISRHIGDIGAAALGAQALRKSLSATQEATRAAAQTSDLQGRSAIQAVIAGQKLQAVISDTTEGLVKYGSSVDEATEIARRLYTLSGKTSVRLTESLGALALSYGVSTQEFFGKVEADMRAHGKTLKEALHDWAGLEHQAKALRQNLEDSGVEQRRINMSMLEFKKVVQETKDELGDSAVSVDALARAQKAAFEWAQKHNMTVADTVRMAKNVGKLLKLPEYLQHQVGKDLFQELRQRRDAGEDIDSIISSLVDTGRLRADRKVVAKDIIQRVGAGGGEDIQSIRQLAELLQESRSSATIALQAFQKFAGQNNRQATLSYIKESTQGSAIEAAEIYSFLQSGDLARATKELEQMGYAVEGKVTEEQKAEREKAEQDVEKTRKDLVDNASTIADDMYAKLQGLLQKPAALLAGSLAMYLGGLALASAQRSAIVAELTALNASTAALAGTQVIGAGAGLLGKAGKAVAIGATAYGGYKILDAIVGSDDPTASAGALAKESGEAEVGPDAAAAGTEVGILQSIMQRAKKWQKMSPLGASGPTLPDGPASSVEKAPENMLKIVAGGGRRDLMEGIPELFSTATAVGHGAQQQATLIQEALSKPPNPLRIQELASSSRGRAVSRAALSGKKSGPALSTPVLVQQTSDAGEFFGQLVDALLSGFARQKPESGGQGFNPTYQQSLSRGVDFLSRLYTEGQNSEAAPTKIGLRARAVGISSAGELTFELTNPEVLAELALEYLKP